MTTPKSNNPAHMVAQILTSWGKDLDKDTVNKAAQFCAQLVPDPLTSEERFELGVLRATVANRGGPCIYCALPKEEWARCRLGFPGCDRADDAMLCPNVGASLWADDKLIKVERFLRGLAVILKTSHPALAIRIERLRKELREE